MNIKDSILDLIFPPSCGICGKIGEGYICKNCEETLRKYYYNNTREDIFYLFHYKDIIREKLIDYKFNDKSYLYHTFCEIFVKKKIACDFIKRYDIIIPVPMYKRKKAKRGYNQSELIAKGISKMLDIPIESRVLIKKVNTPTQSTLGRMQRIENVQNVYKIEKEQKIQKKNVVLLDDIYTTGATVNECKKMLELAGCKKVGIIIIAKD